jgi:large subunit ribosomal protein L14
MIFSKSILKVIDNTGVKYVKCIKVIQSKSIGGKKKYGSIGDILLISVKITKPVEKIKKGEMFKAILVRLNKKIIRKYGFLRFFENSVVLVNKKMEPLGNRIFGPIGREALESNFVKFSTIRIKQI